MTNLTVEAGKRVGKKGELGEKLDKVLEDLINKSEDGIEINAAGLAKQAQVKNRTISCVSALKRAIKKYPGSQILVQGTSNYTVRIVKQHTKVKSK